MSTLRIDAPHPAPGTDCSAQNKQRACEAGGSPERPVQLELGTSWEEGGGGKGDGGGVEQKHCQAEDRPEGVKRKK